MNGIHRSLLLLRDGQDIHPPRELLEISARDAHRCLPRSPYSIATNLAHAANWQQLWLHRLGKDGNLSDNIEQWNWPKAEEAVWPDVCQRFLTGLDQAIEAASGEVDEETEFILNQILIHDAYHIGECMLLCRLLE